MNSQRVRSVPKLSTLFPDGEGAWNAPIIIRKKGWVSKTLILVSYRYHRSR